MPDAIVFELALPLAPCKDTMELGAGGRLCCACCKLDIAFCAPLRLPDCSAVPSAWKSCRICWNGLTEDDDGSAEMDDMAAPYCSGSMKSKAQHGEH